MPPMPRPSHHPDDTRPGALYMTPMTSDSRAASTTWLVTTERWLMSKIRWI